MATGTGNLPDIMRRERIVAHGFMGRRRCGHYCFSFFFLLRVYTHTHIYIYTHTRHYTFIKYIVDDVCGTHK